MKQIRINKAMLKNGDPAPIEVYDDNSRIFCDELIINGTTTIKRGGDKVWAETDNDILYRIGHQWDTLKGEK